MRKSEKTIYSAVNGGLKDVILSEVEGSLPIFQIPSAGEIVEKRLEAGTASGTGILSVIRKLKILTKA